MDYIIDTPCGRLQGTAGRVAGTAAYKGIRYATAGRWEYPQQVKQWEGVYDATAYGSCCWQPRAFCDEAQVPEKAFFHKEFRKGENYTYSEDCLFLNIFTPDSAKKGDGLPVIVYIHGGVFSGGCGHEKPFDGPVWPAKGVIGVTLNYRLGPLGFLCLPELAEEAGHTGNYGLYDQLTALRWLRDNIASFGGDPDNITLMGQSAGAMSVQQHCLSPLTKGLFHKAVMSSGGGVNVMMCPPPADTYYSFWYTLMERADCYNIEQLRAVSVEKLFKLWLELKEEKKNGNSAAGPVMDGKLIVDDGTWLLSQGSQHQIPYMAGSNAQDVMPPVFHNMAKDWCAAQEVPSYAWFFDRSIPGDKQGAWHSGDLWYWFGTLDKCWRPMEQKDYALSEQMTDYLCAFAKSGDPNCQGQPRWEKADSKAKNPVLRLGEGKTAMGSVSKAKLLFTMVTHKPVGE